MNTFEIILTAIGSGIGGGVLTQIVNFKKGKADYYKEEIDYLTNLLNKYKEENKMLKNRIDHMEDEIRNIKIVSSTSTEPKTRKPTKKTT